MSKEERDFKKVRLIIVMSASLVILAFIVGIFLGAYINPPKDLKEPKLVDNKKEEEEKNSNKTEEKKIEIDELVNKYPKESDSDLVFNDSLKTLVDGKIDTVTNFKNAKGQFSNGLEYSISCTDYGELPNGDSTCFRAVLEIPDFNKKIPFVIWEYGCSGDTILTIIGNYLVVHYPSGCGDPGYMYIIEKSGKTIDNGVTWNSDSTDDLYPYMYKLLVPCYITKSNEMFEGYQVFEGKLHFFTHSMIDLSKVSYYIYDFGNDKFDYKGYIIADAYSSQS